MQWMLVFVVMASSGQLVVDKVPFSTEALCDKGKLKVADFLSSHGTGPTVTLVRATCVQTAE